MKLIRILSLLLLAVPFFASAEITQKVRYPLGEAGSLGAANLPLDSVGGYHLQADINGAGTTVVTTGLGAAGSTAALNFNGINQGFYANLGDMNTVVGMDNFGVELWVRTANVTQEGYNFVFSLTGDTLPSTGPVIHLANGRWSASIPGYDWIGGNPFAAGGGVPAVANQWTRIALVRYAGVFRLYVDGVAHPMVTHAAPQFMNGFHLAVNPGGATYFEGDIDEVRIFTFAQGAFKPDDLYQPAPPPVTDFSGTAIITEFAASGTSEVEDEDGSRQDWIEIYNPSPTGHAQLAGWRLTDDVTLPSKWVFPATLIAPESSIVVFASGKNRATAGNELHTNFSLDPDGEYLALIRPDGSVATTFTFPKQKSGASFGTGRTAAAQLVTPSSAAKFMAMTDGSLALTWTQATFADGAWTSGAAAIGYDDGVDDLSGELLQGYWKFDSASGTVAVDSSLRGMNGIITGGAVFTADGGGHTGLAGDRSLDFGAGDGGRYVYWNQAGTGAFDAITMENQFTLSVWVRGASNAPTSAALFNLSMLDGTRSAYAHLPWTDLNIYFDTGGCCGADTRIYKNEPDTTKWKNQWNHYVFLKDGDRKEIWQNGQLWHSGDGTADITVIRSFIVAAGHTGNIDDLAVWAGALTPTQIVGLHAGTLAPDGLNNFTPAIGQQVRTAMFGVTPSAMLRVPFTIATPPAWDELRLSVRYDDAFVAYVNGVEVARRNAPAVASFNSVALSNRTKGAVLSEVAEINISSVLPLLFTNDQPNVLAIHGINDSATSPEFFIEPTLIAYQSVPNRHFSPSTAGARNDGGFADYVRDTSFTVNRGFYDTPQTTTITTLTPDSTLHYTLDGTFPGPGNPASTAVPSSPGGTPSVTLNITTTTVVRAIATRPDWLPTNADTHTYLFPAVIQAQPALPPGLPSTWGVYGGYGPQIGQPVPADYAMNQGVVAGALPTHTVRDGLLSLPALCVSLPSSDLFDVTDGMYVNSPVQGSRWIRPASMEMIYPDGTRASMQVNMGFRIHGGLSRQHWHSPKHSFSLVFKQKYGAAKLDYKLFDDTPLRKWDELVLRASSTDSFAVEYVGAYEYPNDRASYLRDPWMKDSFAAMGQPTGHNRYVNLFLNGVYWGQYNIAEAYVESWHAEMFGGSKEEYDVVKDVDELEAGSRLDWDAALTLAAAGFPDDTAYYRIQGRNPDGTRNLALPVYLDMPNLIDFMILHIYATARDWPVHNWWGGRRRGPLSDGFRFYPWDQEITNLNLAWINTYSGGARFEEVNSAGTPAAFYDKLRHNPRFQREFGDRVQAVCFADGPLTPAACQARWLLRQTQIDKSIVAESARWGDARQATSYTREANWLPEMNWVANTWWGSNHPQALQRFRNVSLFPTVVAPTMSQHGGNIAAGFALTLTAPAGTIYYTTDGAEPLTLAGAPTTTAAVYTGPLTLNADTVVKARVLSASTTSAVTTATFLIADPASALNVVVSEIHFHPLSGGFEFVELMNVGTNVVDLGGVTLSDAVGFTIPQGTKLAIGERVIITEIGATFPPTVRTLGAYTGKLANGGETLVVTAENGDPMWTINFADETLGWPVEADGLGSSLVLMRPMTRPNPDDPANWRSSVTTGGTPGTTDATTFTGTANADIDGDGLNALLEYALGTSDTVPTPAPTTLTKVGADLHFSVIINQAAEDITVTPQISTTLTSWTNATAIEHPRVAVSPGIIRATWKITPPVNETKFFLRARAAQ